MSRIDLPFPYHRVYLAHLDFLKNYLDEFLDKKFSYILNQYYSSFYFSIEFHTHVVLEITLRDNNFVIRTGFGDEYFRINEREKIFSIHDPDFDINKEVETSYEILGTNYVQR